MTARRTAADLARLRARIAALEGFGGDPGEAGVRSLGLPAIDRVLPGGGLARGALHEVVSAGIGAGLAADAGDGAAGGFATRLLSCLAGGAVPSPRGRTVLWVSRRDDLYPPGLRAFGLDPARLLVVRARRDADALWAVEEGLRCPAVAAVLAEVDEPDFTASRRLQLAASGATALLLRPDAAALPASAAATRWRIAPAPGGMAPVAGGVGPARWRVELLRCRGGRPGTWLVEWDDAAGDLAVVAAAGDRPDRRDAA